MERYREFRLSRNTLPGMSMILIYTRKEQSIMRNNLSRNTLPGMSMILIYRPRGEQSK